MSLSINQGSETPVATATVTDIDGTANAKAQEVVTRVQGPLGGDNLHPWQSLGDSGYGAGVGLTAGASNYATGSPTIPADTSLHSVFTTVADNSVKKRGFFFQNNTNQTVTFYIIGTFDAARSGSTASFLYEFTLTASGIAILSSAGLFAISGTATNTFGALTNLDIPLTGLYVDAAASVAPNGTTTVVCYYNGLT